MTKICVNLQKEGKGTKSVAAVQIVFTFFLMAYYLSRSLF